MARSSVIQFPRRNPAEEPRFAEDPGPVSDGSDDEELARRVREGDLSAVEALLERYWQPLVRSAFRLLDDQESAEDVVQDTFVRVWRGRMESRNGPVRAYLFRVARNLALDELRCRGARSRREGKYGGIYVQPSVTPPEVLKQEDIRAAMNAAIQSLPERRREAFTLVYLRDLSYAEASEIMGVSTKTLGNHLSVALADLRKILRPILTEAELSTD